MPLLAMLSSRRETAGRLILFRETYKSAKSQIFPHYESANKLLRKRNSDRYREPQQSFLRFHSMSIIQAYN